MDGTLDFDCFYLGPTFNLNNVTQTHSIFVLKTLENYLFRHVKTQRSENGQFLQCPRSKLIKLRIMPYSKIVVRGQNLQFQLICQKMAMFEQLNDQLLVNSK